MKNSEFKEKARQHQIDFKISADGDINVPADKFYVRKFVRKGTEYEIEVRSSLRYRDCRDEDGGYRIFYKGFRKEITSELDSKPSSGTGQMVTNLLRSEHIPYNVFFPMRHDKVGATRLFNRVLQTNRIATIGDIIIEHNPGALTDGTAFDVFVPYITAGGERGGIGIEVKYTEKEYPLKKDSKEWRETHNAFGIHLSENYRKPSIESGWFKDEYLGDVLFEDSARADEHVVANKYRQIWRNHLLGAAMVLNGSISEFYSLTVYPAGNGHFSSDLWNDYENKLTESGKKTFKHITYEQLFVLMRECFSHERLNEWIDYLEKRYIVNENSTSF